jgi:hypothetical protein
VDSWLLDEAKVLIFNKMETNDYVYVDQMDWYPWFSTDVIFSGIMISFHGKNSQALQFITLKR